MIGISISFSGARAQAVESAPAIVVKESSSSTAFIPNDPLWARQWYLRQINAQEAWAVTTGTSGVVVAIIDVGVDIQHPDLKDVIWTNPHEQANDGIDNDGNGFIDDIHGWNFVNYTPDIEPTYSPVQSEEAWSHGTMVASLIGAKGDDGIGMAGVAWNVRLMPLVALNGTGSGSTQDIVQAIRYAMRMGASIINLSLAGYEEDPALTEVIHQARQSGIVVVSANGNSDKDRAGVNVDEIPSYPACGEKSEDAVIGVGGTDAFDQKAPYANRGKRCTDISAPAHNLLAARPTFPVAVYGNEASALPYRNRVGGTSLAAPLVAGAAALLKSAHPEWTAEQIQRRLYATVDMVSADQQPGTKTELGYGRLNVGRALREERASDQVVSESVVSSKEVLSLSSQATPVIKLSPRLRAALQALARRFK